MPPLENQAGIEREVQTSDPPVVPPEPPYQPLLPFPPGWEDGLRLPPLRIRTRAQVRRERRNPPTVSTGSRRAGRRRSWLSLGYWFDSDSRREIRLWLDARDFRMWLAGIILFMAVISLIVFISEFGVKTAAISR